MSTKTTEDEEQPLNLDPHEQLRKFETLQRLSTRPLTFHWKCMRPGCPHGAACGDGPWLLVFYEA